jgi:FkbM family methyltransferase
MTLATSIQAYFRIRPQRFVDAIRLFFAYGRSALLRVSRPSRFTSVGFLIQGSQNLQVRLDGIRFEVRPRTNDLDLISPKHEPVTTEWLQVESDHIFVDVGAHIGRYTLLAAASGARVIAIEPEPSNFALLERNVKLNGRSNVALIPCAMTDRPRPVRLSLAPPSNTGTSRILPDLDVTPKDSGKEREVGVPGETLDNLVKAHRLTRIDWLKIDAEGHEAAVLEGGESALAIARRLIVEVTEGTAEACRKMAAKHGFAVVSVETGSPASNLLLVKEGG